MMKLIRINRTPGVQVHAPFVRRGEATAIVPLDLGNDHYNRFVTLGEFLLIDEREVKTACDWLAINNPGRDVEVYTLESVSVAPASPVVHKQVTKDGVLPL